MNPPDPIAFEITVNMTSKGQVLIPKAIRDRHGLVPGMPVRVVETRDGTISLEAHGSEGAETLDQRRARVRAALRALSGKYRTGQSTDDYMKLIRGDD